MTAEFAAFLICTVFVGWIVFAGGAEWLEDTWLGEFVLGLLLGIGSERAGVIKVCVAMAWLFGVLLLLVMRSS